MALVECPDCHRQISDSAPSCVGCGRPSVGSPTLMQSETLAARSAIPSKLADLACPHCGSQQTAKVSMVYASGRSNVGLATLGTEFGGDGGLNVAATSGRMVTELAASLAPPQPKKDLTGVAAVAILLLFGLFAVMVGVSEARIGWIIALVGLGLAVFTVWTMQDSAKAYNQTHYQPALEKWKRTYLCQRCATTFLYPATGPAR